MAEAVLRIALAGNPNSGKTTLFNALTGAHHKVGNYPGVTVEKREGSFFRGGREYHVIDLPGIYSLTAYSIDEVVARDFILEEKPDLIVDVLDSTNLERNLYLCLQFQELGIPVVGALNMSDEAEAKGISIDEKTLSATLGMPLVKTAGAKGQGMDALVAAIDRLAPPGFYRAPEENGDAGDGDTATAPRRISYRDEIEPWLEKLQTLMEGDTRFAESYPSRWMAVKLLEKDSSAFARLREHGNAAGVEALAKEATAWIEKHFGKDAEIVISEQRYGYIRGAVQESLHIVRQPDFSLTEKIDRVIMNRFLALPVFILVLYTVFQLTFFIGEYPMAWLEAFFGFLGGALERIIPEGMLRSLIVDGIVSGVGGVLSFVPLIVLLFFQLSVLEDTGYMSRAAFATDKLLHSFGLHGQSIFPMMLGFGCSVPAVMAARTLKSRRDRIITILITPMMSCGAKLPVHVLLAAAFFPENPGNAVMGIYACGVALSLLSAFVLKRTALRGDPTPFVMELPPYRAPTLRGILWHVWEKTWSYVKKAGTIILAASILVWAITTFPRHEPEEAEMERLAARYLAENPGGAETGAYLEAAAREEALQYSIAGRAGRALEPLFRPLGFDWKIAIATVTGFAAKEVVVSTLGILYRVGGEDNDEGLRAALAADPGLGPLKAFTLMLFVLLIPPCFAALATIRAEIGWKWLGFEIVFLLILGWTAAFAVYRIGLLSGGA